jgi:hypothetical protein
LTLSSLCLHSPIAIHPQLSCVGLIAFPRRNVELFVGARRWRGRSVILLFLRGSHSPPVSYGSYLMTLFVDSESLSTFPLLARARPIPVSGSLRTHTGFSITCLRNTSLKAAISSPATIRTSLASCSWCCLGHLQFVSRQLATTLLLAHGNLSRPRRCSSPQPRPAPYLSWTRRKA